MYHERALKAAATRKRKREAREAEEAAAAAAGEERRRLRLAPGDRAARSRSQLPAVERPEEEISRQSSLFISDESRYEYGRIRRKATERSTRGFALSDNESLTLHP